VAVQSCLKTSCSLKFHQTRFRSASSLPVLMKIGRRDVDEPRSMVSQLTSTVHLR
jgi:hypothetical protein